MPRLVEIESFGVRLTDWRRLLLASDSRHPLVQVATGTSSALEVASDRPPHVDW